MLSKEVLTQEIYEEKELCSDWLFTRFKDQEVDSQFEEFSRQNSNMLMWIFGIATIVYHLGNDYFFYVTYNKFTVTFIVYLVHTVLNVTLFSLILNSYPNTTKHYIYCYARYFFNIFRNFHYLIFVMCIEADGETRRISIIRNFYLHSICTKGEFLFFLKASRAITFFTELHCLAILFYSTFAIESDNLIYVPEILACLPGFFMTTAASHLLDFKRSNFLSVKKIETLQTYFEGLLNSMSLQLVSFSNCKAYFSNTAFINEAMIISSEKDSPADFHDQAQLHLNKLIPYNSNNNDRSEDTITNLYDLIKALSKSSNIPDKNEKDNSNKFKFCGQYSNIQLTKYFKVFYRKLEMQSKKVIIDIVIDDITEIKEAELSRIETNLKQKLFSKLAHEFKTPILIIKSLVSDITNSICKLGIKDKSESMILELKSSQITHISEYILFLINDIIYYTNNDSITICKERVDLKAILNFCKNAAIALVSVMPGTRSNISVNANFDDEINYYNVISDGTRIKQILLNLISNSVKFTKLGSISISAEYLPLSNVIEISVKDTGFGMSLEDLERLRINNDDVIKLNLGNSYNQMGTGIGINIVKSILNRLGHAFSITSTKSVGTKFCFTITDISPNELYDIELSRRCTLVEQPNFNSTNLAILLNLNQDEIQTHDYDSVSISTYNKLSTPCIQPIEKKQKPVIIVVDDSISLRKSVINLLKKLSQFSDFEFIECCDGIETLHLVFINQTENRSIEIIVTDENMEYMCGSSTIKLLRNLEANNKIPKIFMVSLTAFVDDTSISYIKSSGANMVLPKPLTNDLAVMIYKSYDLFNEQG